MSTVEASETGLESSTGFTSLFLPLSFRLHPHKLSKKASALVVLQENIANFLYKPAGLANFAPFSPFYAVLS